MRFVVLLAALAVAACTSRNSGSVDARDSASPADDSAPGQDAADPDAALSDAPDVDAPDILDAMTIPPPPVLGEQLDRAGRPLIGTALIGAMSDDTTRAAARDVYSHAADPATWRTTPLRGSVTIEDELEINLAKFDAIDKGFVAGNGNTLTGCQNGFLYSAPTKPESYQNAAALFADDQLYIDTAKTSCGIYLSLEIELASGGNLPHTACGGRTPTHDVVDVTYSVIAAGIDGLDVPNGFRGRIRDLVTAHANVQITFPFLGAPH